MIQPTSFVSTKIHPIRKMRPRIESSMCDDAMEALGFLRFTDENMKSNFLQSLSAMRRNRLFCDVMLLVGNTEIHAHRNVLASVSPYLMELFSSETENINGTPNEGTDKVACYRLNGHITASGLQFLVEYAYTGSLEVPYDLIRDVYLAAWQLKIDNVITECARHMVDQLEPECCIEIRSLPGINRNKKFVQEVDGYITKNFAEVTQEQAFLQLPCILIEILHQTKQEMSLVTDTSLYRLVLNWTRRQITEDGVSMSSLMERSHMLYLALDNSLQDCVDLPGLESESDLVQDYKRLVLKCPGNKNKQRKGLKTPGRPRMIVYNQDLSEDHPQDNCDWNLIGSSKVGDHTFIGLVTLDGNLSRISIQLRLNAPTTPSPINTPDTISSSVSREEELDEIQKPELFCEVATMSGPKCGLGVAELEGKLLVCGGYDRTECLKSVESYCPDTNSWTQICNMGEARGRVNIAVINGTVYAVGGCNGTTELDSVEYLSQKETKWKKMCKLPLARSNAGVCALDDKIYCVGGWNGQTGIKQCDVLIPDENKWSSIAHLNTGRYQAGVAPFKGKLWVAGGSDAWNCLSSVENYDPEVGQWNLAPSLLTPRRGCGLAEFNGKLYAVGGSDGTHSLTSTEYFDETNKCWISGPNLTSARANVSVAVVQNRLYAIGGFSGKTFLNTIEYLDAQSNEWTTFVPQTNSNIDSLLQSSLRNGSLSDSRAGSSSTSSSPDNLSGQQNGGGGCSEHTFKPIRTAEVNAYNLGKSHQEKESSTDKEVKDILATGTKKLSIDEEELNKTNGTINSNDNSIKLQKIVANNCAEIASENGNCS
ncbi:influenza virus NS1A-binding protein-like isoform X1 [Uranotaenia lowii]|uniref:influenza virus NS1A-binding protein-like isoform X1 n=1 Tax=Uranotaenia lowii TaxID=190385 RepID=UPI002478C003|nr:influenza virus NS1A-binding protein-like isoform X1 [Uranotaenia lowii]XP_055602816.1 influenza virus NS1A-binding protein-like isoform X1 [Uranotaenia lowii]